MAQPGNMIQVDPGCSIKGPILRSLVWSEEHKRFLEQLEWEVRHGDDLAEPIFGELSRQIVSPNTNKAKIVVRRIPQNTLVTSGYSPDVFTNCDYIEGNEEGLRKLSKGWKTCCRVIGIRANGTFFDHDDNGAEVNVTIGGTLPLTTVKQTITKLNSTNAILCETTVASWCENISWENAPEFDFVVKVTRSIVAKGTAFPAWTSGQIITQADIDCWKAIRIVRELQDWENEPFDRRELIGFNFPSFLKSVSGGLNNSIYNIYGHARAIAGYLPRQRRTTFKLNINLRAGFQKVVRSRVRLELFASLPAEQSLFEWKTQSLRYDGTLFSVNVPNVLNDLWTLTANTNSADTYYGFGTEEAEFNASTPVSSTAYAAAIGTEKLVREEVSKWGYGLYLRKSYYIDIE
jgi:hypothetical protein